MTQKQLGISVGFSESTVAIRIAQYESGQRTPKTETISKLADVLDVDPGVLTLPNIGTPTDVMYLRLALENKYNKKQDSPRL